MSVPSGSMAVRPKIRSSRIRVETQIRVFTLSLFSSRSSLDQIWTTAVQLTTTDYNSRQLIEAGVIIGNVTQAVVVSCG